MCHGIRNLLAGLTLAACSGSDPNATPTYGETGLPKNCRATVQANVNMYRETRASSADYRRVVDVADGVIASLERNCGENGHAWGK